MPQIIQRILGSLPTDRLARLITSQQQVEAKRFARYVLSPQGQAVLQRYGFSKP